MRKKVIQEIWLNKFFHKQLDFCFTLDFLFLVFQVRFSLCKWIRNIYLVWMYFHEKLQTSLAIFGGLVPLIANVSITAIEDNLLL